MLILYSYVVLNDFFVPGLRLHVCAICGSAFALSVNLITHISTVHESKSEMSVFSFSDLSDLFALFLIAFFRPRSGL